jgi:hypothetical protein
VLSTLPVAFTTSMVLAWATSIAAGASIAAPLASRQVPGAYHSVPSGARVKAQGEKVAPAGATTHRPGDHAHRAWRHVHSPSTQTAPAGIGGIASTRPGGGGTSTAVRALVGCGAYVGCASDRVHPATAAASQNETAIRIRCERDWSTTIGRRRA